MVACEVALLTCETSAVATDGLLKAEVEGIGDECMPDGDLGEEGDRLREETEVLQTEVVPCIECQPEGASVLSSLDEGSYSLGAICRIVRGIGLGIELDTIGAKGSSCIKVLEIRADKDRGAYAPSVELAEDLREEVAVASYIPARITRQSIGGIGH
jgi:hypothetical protein